jgi:hypothetical protein
MSKETVIMLKVPAKPGINNETRRRIEEQGFMCLTDSDIVELNYWLRLAPAVCLTWMTIGVVQASPSIIIALAPFAALGGILRGHPFDVIYNLGLRHIFHTREIPAYGMPRRFTFLLASMMLAFMASAFYLGYLAVGYGVCVLMIASGASLVGTGLCMPARIYGRVFGSPKCSEEDPRSGLSAVG